MKIDNGEWGRGVKIGNRDDIFPGSFSFWYRNAETTLKEVNEARDGEEERETKSWGLVILHPVWRVVRLRRDASVSFREAASSPPSRASGARHPL